LFKEEVDLVDTGSDPNDEVDNNEDANNAAEPNEAAIVPVLPLVGETTTNKKTVKKAIEKCKQRKPGAGRPSLILEENINRLKEFYDEKRKANLSVSTHQLMIEAKRIDRVSLGVLSSNALRLRIRRLLGQWDVSWRRATKIAQKKDHDIEMIQGFRETFFKTVKMIDVSPENVYNFDQTNISFSQHSKFTLENKGAKTVSVKGAESSSRCTVMLGASWGGKKAPPFIVYIGSAERGGRIRKEIEQRTLPYPVDCELSVQAKGWFDEKLMLEWIEKIWKKHICSENPDQFRYLILDEFRCHKLQSVRDALLDCNTFLEIIPPGYTSVLQVCDIGLNKPMKGYMNRIFDEWLVVNIGNKPCRHDVANWIVRAWEMISEHCVTNSWRRSLGYEVWENEVDPAMYIQNPSEEGDI
jgi:DDE superfamily endonuclease